jgi:hypothetical protein
VERLSRSVARLERKLDGREPRGHATKAEVDALRADVERLRAALLLTLKQPPAWDQAIPPEDELPFDRWVREHPTEVARLTGRFVAFDAATGVVAEADTVAALVRIADDLELPPTVLFAGIPVGLGSA